MTTKHVGRVGLAHGSSWNMEWCVLFHDNHAIIYHGHVDPNDHSDCGPKVFCCPKAAQLLIQIHLIGTVRGRDAGSGGAILAE